MAMEKKEEFKSFVKKNPHLISFVKKGEMTWQKFYEIFDLYGEDEEVWKEYIKKEEPKLENKNTNSNFDFLKNIDLDSIQNGVGSLQRVLGLLGDLSSKDSSPAKEEYKPRPLYKHFED